MKAPRSFVARLSAFDPELRVVWAPRVKTWFIERRLPERHRQLLAERPNPFKGARGKDLYDSWRQGYVHVLSVPPDLLDERVFDALAEADAWRQGGFEAINRRLDAEREAEEQQADRAIAHWSEAAASEAYDRLMWLQGNRVAVHPSQAERGSPDTVEVHEGFTVRVRKGQHQEEGAAWQP